MEGEGRGEGGEKEREEGGVREGRNRERLLSHNMKGREEGGGREEGEKEGE